MTEKKISIFSITLTFILGFEAISYYQSTQLKNEAEKIIATYDSQHLNSSVKYSQLKGDISNKNSIEKENMQIDFLKNIVYSKESTLSDYSFAALVLSELLYSEKYLNIQERFDNKNLFDVDEKQLTDNDKKYKSLLILNNDLDEKFKTALTDYQNGRLKDIILKYKNVKGYLTSFNDREFISFHKHYNKMIDEYKLQQMLVSPDAFDYLVEHFKKHKSFNKGDYYDIIKKINDESNLRG